MVDESLLEEIIPRQTIKPVGKAFVKKDIGSSKGKSSKYLKEVTIPSLQMQIANLKRDVENARNRRDAVKAGKRSAVKNAKDQIWRKQKASYAVTQTKINQRAREWFYDKVKVTRLLNSTYLDGLTAYPIVQQYARHNNIHYKKLGLFVLMNHFNWFQLKDSEYYGYGYEFTSKTVRELVSDGLVEKFVGRRASFTVTLKGQKLFLNFQRFYTQRTKELFKRWDNRFTQRTGGTSVKLKHRFISKVELYEEL